MDVLPAVDVAAVFVALVVCASVVTAGSIVWKPIRRWTAFADLITRELTGWDDAATGERHPSLRAEIRDLRDRVGVVEQATKQLKPNGGTHLYDAIRRIEVKADATAERIVAVETALDGFKPKPRARKPKGAGASDAA